MPPKKQPKRKEGNATTETHVVLPTPSSIIMTFALCISPSSPSLEATRIRNYLVRKLFYPLPTTALAFIFV